MSTIDSNNLSDSNCMAVDMRVIDSSSSTEHDLKNMHIWRAYLSSCSMFITQCCFQLYIQSDTFTPVIGKIIALRSSGASRKLGALIVRYSQKKECISFVFYTTLEPLFRFRWDFQQNVCLLMMRTSNQTESWKYHMFDCRLIPLDRITVVIGCG